MISINNLTVSFGGFTLFDNVNFHINENDKIGLVGKNGAGKTTILKIVAGIIAPSGGAVQQPSEITIGYLPQEMEYSKKSTVIEETLKAFSHIKKIEERIAKINKDICERTDFESDSYHDLIVRFNELNDKLNLYGTINPQALSERVLKGLGFSRSDLERERATLSLGWNMRIELAKILLRKPDILLLDEPTNHLDIESIRWLESYLQGFRGALVLISHDRRFLDSVTNRTVEITLGKINDYKVPYTKYTQLRRERLEQQKAAYDNQQKLIEKTEDFIERFRYKATKSNQVQSRIKQLDKLDRIEVEEEDKAKLYLKFPPAPRSGNVALKSIDVKMSFGDKCIFDKANITIERGEKIALLGKNGEGKTTFMRLITGELTPVSGRIELGHNVSLGYYAQNQEDLLNKEDTVFDTLDNVATGDVRTKLRDILGSFLFRGEDIDKKVAVLSGGEKSRLAMAKLMLKPYNLLALDEPTNHMDIRSKDILKQALLKYDGTLVIVSHDRDFLDGLVNKIYEFKDGAVREHLGTFEEFLSRKNIESLDELEFEKSALKATPEVKQQESVMPVDHNLKREQEREQKRRQAKIEKSEKRIEELESKIASAEKELAGISDAVKILSLVESYEKLKKELNSEMEEWEKLHNNQ
ncbi:MAG: glycosyl transferase family 2 [Bacteroidetes bacterium GWE2_39_28]|nr:MAG: glycosyl transferase family 2 [Bacteroidetes bacterium GWE2_39_28]OFY14080.1 MAG: glycosyl transferase family 2 [Bacteroidetes bacterium GWF2_39_10]HCT94020.1 glycosyl transferase family 2 [Rikenellaceae bacterium]